MFVLQDQCGWKSDLPTILSVCLISLEPDSVLRVMQDQFTPGQIRDQNIIKHHGVNISSHCRREIQTVVGESVQPLHS